MMKQYPSNILTHRQHQLLECLSKGLTVKDVANEWNVSIRTVEAHKFILYKKLDIHSYRELISIAKDETAKFIVTDGREDELYYRLVRIEEKIDRLIENVNLSK